MILVILPSVAKDSAYDLHFLYQGENEEKARELASQSLREAREQQGEDWTEEGVNERAKALGLIVPHIVCGDTWDG